MSEHNHRRAQRNRRRQPRAASVSNRDLFGNSARDLRPASRRVLIPGAVVHAHVSYHNDAGWKTRPCIVLEAGHQTVTVLPLTSSPSRHHRPNAYELTGWQESGLSRPTGVVFRAVTVDRVDVIGRIGHLTEQDADAITARLDPGLGTDTHELQAAA